MEDYEIIEADFQQFYNLDLAEVSFSRYMRLLLQLPLDSRFVKKYSPMKDWNWDKEVQSQILRKLDELSCQLANMFKKKGSKKAKPQEQMQPDYVKKAKNEYEHDKNQPKEVDEATVADIEAFWKSKNPNARFLGDGNNE